MAANRRPVDDARRSISQYRKLADTAKLNAAHAMDASSRDWFFALAKAMKALADGLEMQSPTSK